MLSSPRWNTNTHDHRRPRGSAARCVLLDSGVRQLGRILLARHRVRRVQARFSKKYEARPRRVGIRGRCVYLWTAPAAVRVRKSAAAHWRDAICSFCCSASSRAERHANNSALCCRDARYCIALRQNQMNASLFTISIFVLSKWLFAVFQIHILICSKTKHFDNRRLPHNGHRIVLIKI